MAIAPPALNKGDTIGVFAPSSWVDKDDIDKSTKRMEDLGYKVFIHPQTFEREHQSAGTHLQKALAFQGLWMRKDIKAIWAAGGGNRCMHMLDILKVDPLKRSEKILVGFSDVSALLNTVYAKTDNITTHGPVFKNLHSYKQMDHLLELLSGQKVSYPIESKNILANGKAEGILLGGNLSLFQYMLSLYTDDQLENSIIFLEDCYEELSRIDRMLCHLKRSELFQKTKAIIFGEFSALQDSSKPFGFILKDILQEHTDSLDIPILYNMPFGHGEHLYSFPVGGLAELDTDKPSLKLLKSATTD